MPLFSLTGTRPADLGVHEGRLRDCPSSPNCVCSDCEDRAHHVEPLGHAGDAKAAWAALRRAVLALPRSEIVSETETYLHAECHSALLGFVDDLELQLRDGEIAVRSASRLGHSDLGVNRKRVESLRSALAARGALA